MAGVALLLSLFFFGKTVEKKPVPAFSAATQAEPAFSIDNYLQTAKQKLTVSQSGYVAAMENNISRGDLKAQQTDDYKQLAAFWLDTVAKVTPDEKMGSKNSVTLPVKTKPSP